jgi:hypothetical protein
MEKARKLRRYNRKDYAQLVDFPVEIVGRDGKVRRYSFEESVRLYQRRIASASLRYEDGEVAEAEIQHCRRRIEQLRRSYFARYGWSEVREADPQAALPSELAGEVAAFLRRTFPEDGAEAMQFGPLEVPGPEQLFAVQRMGEDGPEHYLLYLYRFDPNPQAPEREAFFRFIKILQGVRGSPEGVESLVAFHHTADCGLVLTGQAPGEGEEPRGAESSEGGGGAILWMDDEDGADPLRDGMVALRKGSLPEALRAFTAAYETNHYRKAAYVWAVGVAEQLGEHEHAQMAAWMGSRYFPSDTGMAYNLAITHLHGVDPKAALEALTAIPDKRPVRGPLMLVRGLADLAAGEHRRGHSGLRAALALLGDDDDLQAAAQTVLQQLRLHTIARGLAITLAAVGLLGGLDHLAIPAFALPLAVGLWLVGNRVWRRSFEQLLRQPAARGLRLSNPVAFRQASVLGGLRP